jgi:hypothetical protein
MNIVNLRTEISNPFDRWDYFKNLGSVSGRFTRYKAWELEHTYYSPLLFDIDIQWSRNTDHAGFEFGIGILGYGVHFRIHDTRHWNYTTNSWEEHNFDEYFKTNS